MADAYENSPDLEWLREFKYIDAPAATTSSIEIQGGIGCENPRGFFSYCEINDETGSEIVNEKLYVKTAGRAAEFFVVPGAVPIDVGLWSIQVRYFAFMDDWVNIIHGKKCVIARIGLPPVTESSHLSLTYINAARDSQSFKAAVTNVDALGRVSLNFEQELSKDA